ncbi:MAG: phosphohistidine phosphatase SixA [Sedimentisphaerales bacterium]|nr:phosphohistidine phosphatase SixA [Sedimentisphaerales bacterium]
MRIYIVRHGRAASSAVDSQRGLTEEGRAEVEKVAQHLRGLDLAVDCVWHSGKARAEQTAEILAKAIIVRETADVHAGLSPNGDAVAIRDEIESAGQDIMIVSHIPFVAGLASLLLEGSESTWPIDFKEATVACLERTDETHWQIEWIITPEISNSSSVK